MSLRQFAHYLLYAVIDECCRHKEIPLIESGNILTPGEWLWDGTLLLRYLVEREDFVTGSRLGP